MQLKFVLNKIFWFYFKPARTLYRFVVRPEGKAVKVLVRHGNEFLLVRPTYSHKLWSIPGGGVESNEMNEQAVYREVLEEVGLNIASPICFGEYIATVNYRTDRVYCFVAETNNKDFKIDGIEISKASWFSLQDFPSDRTPSVDKIIALYRKNQKLLN